MIAIPKYEYPAKFPYPINRIGRLIISSRFISLFASRRQTLEKKVIQDIFPGFKDSTITIFHPAMTKTGCRLIELALFAYLAHSLDDIYFFEIGTSEGRSARTIAINLGDQGHLTTIDLPISDKISARRMPEYQKGELKNATNKFIETLPEKILQKITLLKGNSTEFDLTSHNSQYDVVFVDGNHSHESVLVDDRNARQLLRPTGGIILFHDYLPGTHQSVAETIHFLSRKNDMYWLDGTKIAISVVGKPRISINLNG